MALPLLEDTRFQVFSLPSPGFFSPFPRGTCSLSVRREYLGLRDGPRRFRQDFTCPALLGVAASPGVRFAYGTLTLYRRPFHAVRLQSPGTFRGPATPHEFLRTVWPLPLSLATTE